MGRPVEFVTRVNGNDPANSALLVRLLASSGVESDATLKDKDDGSALVSGTTDYATNTGYSQKTLTDASGMTITVDDTNDRTDLDCADQTWTAVANDGTGAIGDLVFLYDSDTTGGTDSNLIPISQHDFSVTPNGGDISATIGASGWFRAS